MAAGNPSQYMFEKAFERHELDWRYLTLEINPEDLGDAVRGMRVMGYRGGNCTEPFKRAISEHLDRLGKVAELVGVVNCVWRDEDQFVGENTEGAALLEAVRRRIDPAGRRCVLLGAGRMGRAIAVELALAGVEEIVVVNRSEASGRELVDLLGERLEAAASLVVWDEEYRLPAETGLLVHATPLGSADPDAPLPINLDELTAETLVVDVSIDPPDPWLLHEAVEREARVLDGLEIFIEQALINFKLWTGVDADAAVIRDAVEEFLEL
jgi:shikimate dehydrogenase